MYAFLKKLFKSEPVKIKVVAREACELRLSEWRSDSNLTKAAARLLASTDMRLMLDVLQNEHPGATVMIRGEQSDRAAQQARAEGYTICLSNLKALGIHQPAAKQLGEPTFEPEEKE